MKSIHPGIRFLIVVAITVLYILALIQWGWFDGLLRSFWIGAFLISIAIGALCAGIMYAVLPVKKTVEQSKDAFNEKKYRKAVIGYWTWIALGAGLYSLAMFGRIWDL
jgi:hypothetical protein